PTYIQNPDQLQLLTEPNLEKSLVELFRCKGEDNHKGKLNKNNLIFVTNDEGDEFDDWRSNLSNLRGGYLDDHDEMIKEDIEQESLPGSWLRVAASATTTTREDSISKMSSQCPRLDLEDGRIELCVSQLNQGFCKLTEKYPGEICDWLNLIYESLKDYELENDNELERSNTESKEGPLRHRLRLSLQKRLPWERQKRARVLEAEHSRQVGRNEMVDCNDSTPIRHCSLQSGTNVTKDHKWYRSKTKTETSNKDYDPQTAGDYQSQIY
ncbi:hypothetical protein BY996DRAFT_6610358, partial [Phakopsora pachyrhizi]